SPPSNGRRSAGRGSSRLPSPALLDLSARDDRPDALDPALAHGDDLLMEMDSGIAVADEELDALADARRDAWDGELDRGVLGRQPQIAHIGECDRLWHGGIAAHRFLAGVENDAGRRRPAGHGGEERKGLREIDVVVVAIVKVAEERPADLHFGDAGLAD